MILPPITASWILWLAASPMTGSAMDLQAAAAASPRPHRCVHLQTNTDQSVWRRASDTRLTRCCHLLARATARLDEDPAAALLLSRRARQLAPEMAGAHVVAARAAMRQDDIAGAMQSFERAAKLDRRSLDPPIIMFERAFVAWRSGQRKLALDLYRALAPRVALLPSRATRALSLLRAAHLTLSQAAAVKPRQRAPILRQAIAYLREAHQDQNHRLRKDVSLSLALTLIVAGRPDAARLVLNEDSRLDRWGPGSSIEYLDHPHHVHLLHALANERRAPKQAATQYELFLSRPAPPFRDVIAKRAKRLGARKAR